MDAEDKVASGPGTARLLATLERLLAIETVDLTAALDTACNLVAEALGADKVDALFHEVDSDSLVAAGTSDTPMGRKQHAIGMDRLPLANGGREAEVYRTGQVYATGRADRDPEQLRGITDGLGIRSAILVPLDVASVRRGVFLASSARPDFFAAEDLPFLEAVARWVGMVAHRTELVERIAAEAREQGRRVAADDLIATLAHDLGNLIAPIKGRLDLLRRRARREGRERDLHDLAAAAHAVDRLTALMRDLLDSSRLEQGLFALEAQPADLAELVRETCAALATPQVPILVEAPAELALTLDANRIRQALENLLANAVKHAPAGTPVTVTVTVDVGADRSAERAVVTVADEGPGIPADLVGRLFDRFARGADSTGLGLGLYLASRIAAAHGGALTADPQPAIGARFSLRLPFEGPASDVLGGQPGCGRRPEGGDRGTESEPHGDHQDMRPSSVDDGSRR
jgi:signal transduction histidine kinase